MWKTVEVEVEVDLDLFDDDDIIEEVESRIKYKRFKEELMEVLERKNELIKTQKDQMKYDLFVSIFDKITLEEIEEKFKDVL